MKDKIIYWSAIGLVLMIGLVVVIHYYLDRVMLRLYEKIVRV